MSENTKRTKQVLGLDVGNAKVKALFLAVNSGNVQQCHWDSLPLPVSQDRATDFAVYLPLQLLQFLQAQGLEKEQLDQVVVCCSHSFAFDPYSASILHLAQVLSGFFETVPVALVRADGELTPLSELPVNTAESLYGYVFSNFYGSAWLASQKIDNGLSLDMGTTTLDIIPIHNGCIDPQGLANPNDYLRFRYHQDRIHWLGMTVTPLEKLAQRISCAGQSYQVVPRGYRTENLFVSSVNTSPPKTSTALLQQHAYGKRMPELARAQRYLAESIGLDRHLLSADDIEEIRQGFLEALITQVSQAIARVLEQEFANTSQSTLKIATFALGAEAVLKPALQQLGISPTQWVQLDYGQDSALWSATSVFAMALLALERQGEHLAF